MLSDTVDNFYHLLGIIHTYLHMYVHMCLYIHIGTYVETDLSTFLKIKEVSPTNRISNDTNNEVNTLKLSSKTRNDFTSRPLYINQECLTW